MTTSIPGYPVSDYSLDEKLAALIVKRTMQIISCNINIMDQSGRIIGSGDPTRIGEMHEGALLALSQKRMVAIHNGSLDAFKGVKPGLNIPLKLQNRVVGVIGLTGNPQDLNNYGSMVCMIAEMMLEQARLMQLLAHNSRLREELVLNLIRNTEFSPTMQDLASRLSVDLNRPRVAIVVELDSGQLGVSTAMAELQHLQNQIMESGYEDLMAIVSLNEIVMLRPVDIRHQNYDPEKYKQQVERLYKTIQDTYNLRLKFAIGHFFPGEGGLERSYQTAKTTMKVGRQRFPDQDCYCYQDMELPVLLDGLKAGWQSQQLLRPLELLRQQDNNGSLRKTVLAWFNHNTQAAITAQALYIHKNTLEYRLRRVSEITGLELSKFEDRLMLYIALHLDMD